MGQDDKGEYLSKEERIRRFKGEPLAKPDDLKPGDTETPAAETSDAEVDTEKSQEGLVSILKSIAQAPKNTITILNMFLFIYITPFQGPVIAIVIVGE